MTHAELVQRAERWLRKSRGCGVVLIEPSGCIEIPDAIGWGARGFSVMVECKTSRADFLADRRKPFRGILAGEMAIGDYRFYMAPPGIIAVADLPPLWGLLEVRPTQVRQLRRARQITGDTGLRNLRQAREISLLLSAMRKVQIVEQGGTLHDWKAERAKRKEEERLRKERAAENVRVLLELGARGN